MAKHWRSLLPIALLLFVLLGGCVVSGPTVTPESNVSANGVTVDPRFQEFQEQHGGVTVFGYPLSTYDDEETGRTVQYFQRMRLEHDPVSQEILVTALGEWAMPDPAEQVLAPGLEENQDGSISASELTVQDAFALFYNEHGGEELFGPPISPQLDEGGSRVQYFKNARLEWHPEAPRAFRVQVGLLGEAHYRQVGFYNDPARYRAVESLFVEEAKVSANLRAPILYSGEEQVVFVDVETPDGGRPIPDVSVELSLKYDGKSVARDLGATDGNGHAQGVLDLPEDIVPGQKVLVNVVAQSPRKQIGSTTISFKTWW